MGKKIRLTEEQIQSLFGEFGEKLLENSEKGFPMMPNKTVPKQYASKAGHSYAGGTKGDDYYYYTGNHYVPKPKAFDNAAYAGSIAKMASLGMANLNKENALNNDNNALLERIRKILTEERGGGSLNIIDVLRILHKIKNEEEKITNKEAVNFLNSIDIDYILSNFVTVNAPDYVFFRLKNLTEEEIKSERTAK